MGAEINKACCSKEETNEVRFGSNMDPPQRNVHSREDQRKYEKLQKDIKGAKKQFEHLKSQCDILTEQNNAQMAKMAKHKEYETQIEVCSIYVLNCYILVYIMYCFSSFPMFPTDYNFGLSAFRSNIFTLTIYSGIKRTQEKEHHITTTIN